MNAEKITINQKSKSKLDLRLIYEDLYFGYFLPERHGGEYSKLGALIDLIIMCNHEDLSLLGDDEWTSMECGNTNTTLSDLAEQWGWERNKVNAFLKQLEQQGIIRTQSSKNGTVISLCDLSEKSVILDS